jgi:8-oxo-dGTP pyrophosphatase MutT (NUDIX family)
VTPGTLHADATVVLDRWRAPDAEQEALRELYLRYLTSYDDAMWRSCHPEHLTASALVLDPDADKVLLTLHAKVGRWLQLGGHCEPEDSTLAAAALREATEESGLADLRLLPDPVQLSRHPLSCDGRPSYHLDVQYVAFADHAAAAPVVSEESHDLGWFGVDELPPDVDGAVRSLVRRSVASEEARHRSATSSDAIG